MGKTAEHIKAVVKEDYGHTVREVAEIINVCRPNLSNVLNGKTALSISMAYKLQESFGINANRLLHDQLEEDIKKFNQRKNKT